MADLTYYVATTLDGYIGDPDGGFDFFPVDGDHLPALVDAFPETFPVHVRGALGIADVPNRRFDTVMMGRRTYEPALSAGITSPYPHLDQHVVSGTLGVLDDPAVTLVEGDPVAHVRALKQEDRLGIWLCGGGQLAGALLDEIDELILKVNPVLVGAGTRMAVSDFAQRSFTHVQTDTYASGVVVVQYRRAR